MSMKDSENSGRERGPRFVVELGGGTLLFIAVGVNTST